MSATHNDWYATNAARSYPIDDAATAVDDAGTLLPAGLLVDAGLTVPDTLGDYLYLAALAVSDRGVTAVFAASADPAVTAPAGPSPFRPVAAVTVPAPIEAGRQYPVTPLCPGAAGWVVFGPDAAAPVAAPYAGRFASVRQSQLLVRCATARRVPPADQAVPSLARSLGPPLVGIVALTAGTDLELAVQTVSIAGDPVTAVAIGLADDPTGESPDDVYAKYAAPCQGRPQERDCPAPVIESIGGVVPDCHGRIELEFRHAYAAVDHCGYGGITLDLPVGLALVCPPPDRSLVFDDSVPSCSSQLAPDDEPPAWSSSIPG